MTERDLIHAGWAAWAAYDRKQLAAEAKARLLYLGFGALAHRLVAADPAAGNRG